MVCDYLMSANNGLVSKECKQTNAQICTTVIDANLRLLLGLPGKLYNAMQFEFPNHKDAAGYALAC